MISGAKPIAARHMAVLEELARRLPEIAKIFIMLFYLFASENIMLHAA